MLRFAPFSRLMSNHTSHKENSMKNFKETTTRTQLANLLKIPKKKLTYILYKNDINSLYHSFEIPKKSGGTRKIYAPNKDLKNIQKKLEQALSTHQKFILNKHNINSTISHAFEKDKSIFTNAQTHRNKRFVLNIDLENFFESFHFGRVKGFFEKNKHFQLPSEVAIIIAQLACYNGHLPQGAPSSPVITNLICNNLDIKLLYISKKYKLNYTRYADDLTFSTNNKNFLDQYDIFFEELNKIIEKSGFKINNSKTRLQYRDSKQAVTGLVVNKKINVDRNYYKNTRSMAHSLYTTGEFIIDKKKGTINQLEGRFSFINQVDKYNNQLAKKVASSIKLGFFNLSSREKQYQKFLFYKYFFANSKPLIITEGKTDIDYIKAALKNLYLDYPDLITKKADGTFEFKVTFLKRTKRLNYFLCIQEDGADTMKNIYNYYVNSKDPKFPNYFSNFSKSGLSPKYPVVLILDNEIYNREKPLHKFANHIKLTGKQENNSFFESNHYLNITNNLFLLTHQLVKDLNECEIEDLFDDATLNVVIKGKTFEREKSKFDSSIHFSKAKFTEYISQNYKSINFNEFRYILNNLNLILKGYKKSSSESTLPINQLQNI